MALAPNLSEVTSGRASTLNRHLELSEDQMRRLGYQAIDMVIRHLTQIREKKVMNYKSESVLDQLLNDRLPLEGSPPEYVLDDVQNRVFSNITHHDHPRFFAFVPGPGNFPGAVAECLTNGFNVFSGTWIGGAGAAEIELIVIDWLRTLCGFPAQARGVFLSGGSEAGLVAMATARNALLDNKTADATIYCSDQTHKSIDRDLWLLGFPRENIRRLPSLEDYTLDLNALAEAVRRDRKAGMRPFCLVINTGTTNTGSIDPIQGAADFCEEEGMWLHADGAYGAGSIFSTRGREMLAGLDRVNSIGMDPHKWMFQPYSCGCLIVREGVHLRRTFQYRAEYLKLVDDSLERNFCDYGIQLTRDFRVLKLWLSLKIFGAESFGKAQDWGMYLAEEAERAARTLPNWEVVTQAKLAVLTLRYAPPGTREDERNALNEAIVDQFNQEGYGMVIHTRLRERTVIRMCTINPRTEVSEIHETLIKLDEIARSLA